MRSNKHGRRERQKAEDFIASLYDRINQQTRRNMERIVNPSYAITTELWEDGTRAITIELRDENGDGAVELVFTDQNNIILASQMTDTAAEMLNTLLETDDYYEAVEEFGLMGENEAKPLTTEDLEGL